MPDISKTIKNIEDDIAKSPTDSPIIYISAIVWVAVFISYKSFNVVYNNITESPIAMLNRLQFSKCILFVVLFVILLITVLFFIYNLMFDGDTANNLIVTGIICMCFFTIMGTTFGLLELAHLLNGAPDLVNIFENTLGYFYLFLPINFLKKDMDIHKFSEMFETVVPVGSQGGSQPVDPAVNTNHSYAFLITTISLLNTDTTIAALRGLTSNFKLRTNQQNDDNKIIKDLVFLKYSVGHFVWVYFASLICTFTSIKAFAQYLPSTL